MIDVEKLREDLKNDSIGAAFGGGFGGALLEAAQVEWATEEELIRMAAERGLKTNVYKKTDVFSA